MIFVFGSNLAGIHGAGAARHALEHEGAIWGQGIGHQGNSYGIPTKDHKIKTLPVVWISKYIEDFIKYANEHPELQFKVTQIGCGLAGYHPHHIAPMFLEAPSNCFFDIAWFKFMRPGTNHWN